MYKKSLPNTPNSPLSNQVSWGICSFVQQDVSSCQENPYKKCPYWRGHLVRPTCGHAKHCNSHTAETGGKQLFPAKFVHERGCHHCAQDIYSTHHCWGQLATFYSCLQPKSMMGSESMTVSYRICQALWLSCGKSSSYALRLTGRNLSSSLDSRRGCF